MAKIKEAKVDSCFQIVEHENETEFLVRSHGMFLGFIVVILVLLTAGALLLLMNSFLNEMHWSVSVLGFVLTLFFGWLCRRMGKKSNAFDKKILINADGVLIKNTLYRFANINAVGRKNDSHSHAGKFTEYVFIMHGTSEVRLAVNLSHTQSHVTYGAVIRIFERHGWVPR